MTTIPRTAPGMAIGSIGFIGLAVVLVTALYSVLGFAFGLVGLALVTGSVVRGSNRGIGIGATGMLTGCLVAGVNGSSVIVTIGLIIGTIVVWDGARFAWILGRQLGNTASTSRIILTHIVTSIIVGVLAGTGGYLMYLGVPRPVPPTAVVFLIIAVILLIVGVNSNSADLQHE